MQRSTDRIYTTHVGSLARPAALLDLMRAAAAGQPVDETERAEAERQAVANVVARQRSAGLDVISDGEQTKTGFFAYIGERLSGFEPRPGRDPLAGFRAEIEQLPRVLRAVPHGRDDRRDGRPRRCRWRAPGRCPTPGTSGCGATWSCSGRRSATRPDPDQVFACAVAPSGVGGNEYYPTEAAYLDAVADALHEEYAAIVAAGFTLQIDDPFLTDVFSYGAGSRQQTLERARLYVSAINRSLRGIPPERVRLHTCYGINEGPRVHDAPLADYVDTLFTIRAGAFSFEAANPRHEHVYHVFESVKPPPDAVLLPGVISHATNIVEHPDTIAERIVRFAELVGRENVVASADCGFSSQATYRPEIHPQIVWAKFESLAEGARRATARLWA